MKAAPISASDPQRLQTLRELLILDTPAEERLDKIVAFAASEFDMPDRTTKRFSLLLVEPYTLVRSTVTSFARSPADAAVAITTDRVDQGSIETLKQLEVKRVLLKPFKVKTILETITAFVQAPPAPHKHP